MEPLLVLLALLDSIALEETLLQSPVALEGHRMLAQQLVYGTIQLSVQQERTSAQVLHQMSLTVLLVHQVSHVLEAPLLQLLVFLVKQ